MRRTILSSKCGFATLLGPPRGAGSAQPGPGALGGILASALVAASAAQAAIVSHSLTIEASNFTLGFGPLEGGRVNPANSVCILIRDFGGATENVDAVVQSTAADGDWSAGTIRTVTGAAVLEPATLALVGLGLVAAGAVARRRAPGTKST